MSKSNPPTWTATDAADAWGISARRVNALLKSGRVPGAERANDRNGTWLIPENTPRPAPLRPGPKPSASADSAPRRGRGRPRKSPDANP